MGTNFKHKSRSNGNSITESLAMDWYSKKTGTLFPSSKKFNKKKILKEYLTELFDPVNDEKYNLFSLNQTDQIKLITIRDDVFEIEMTSSKILEGFFQFSFKRIKSKSIPKPKFSGNDIKSFSAELNQFEYGLSNSSSAVMVLKTVQSVMFTFLENNKPRGIFFKDYDEGLRSKTYSYITKKLANESKYFIMEKNNYFYLFRDKNDMLGVKNKHK